MKKKLHVELCQLTDKLNKCQVDVWNHRFCSKEVVKSLELRSTSNCLALQRTTKGGFIFQSIHVFDAKVLIERGEKLCLQITVAPLTFVSQVARTSSIVLAEETLARFPVFLPLAMELYFTYAYLIVYSYSLYVVCLVKFLLHAAQS